MTLERHLGRDAGAWVEWDRFVQGHVDGTPFHLSAWIGCLCASYGFEASLCLLRDGSREIRAAIPFLRVQVPLCSSRYVSLPFSDYGGMLAADAGAGGRLMDGVIQTFDEKHVRLEVRSGVPDTARWTRHTSYLRHSLDLRPGVNEILKHVDKRTIQYSIRKAEKAGITIEEATTEGGLAEFYRLHRLTRAKHGVPSQPRRFFEALMSGLAPTATPRILLALDQGCAIAAGFFIEFGRTLYFKYSASDPQCLSSKTPNHLLTWHAIQAGCERGLDQLDFGRSASSNEGLCRYKRMWGAAESELPYSYFPDEGQPGAGKETGTVYGLLTSLWRRLPVSIQDRIGPRVYRYLA